MGTWHLDSFSRRGLPPEGRCPSNWGMLTSDLTDKDYPAEARSLGPTLLRWRHEIAAWHSAHVSNGPTEAVNNLIKRVKRAAFGFRHFRNYRVRALRLPASPTVHCSERSVRRWGDRTRNSLIPLSRSAQDRVRHFATE